MANFKEFSKEELLVLKSYVFNDEQKDVLIKLAGIFNSSNRKSERNVRTLANEDIAACVRTLYEDETFLKKDRGHWYCLYRVLIDDEYLPEMNVTDFRRHMQKILNRNDKIFSDSIMTKYSATELKVPVDEWKQKVRRINLRSFILIADKFRSLLKESSGNICTNKED